MVDRCSDLIFAASIGEVKNPHLGLFLRRKYFFNLPLQLFITCIDKLSNLQRIHMGGRQVSDKILFSSLLKLRHDTQKSASNYSHNIEMRNHENDVDKMQSLTLRLSL